MDTIRWIISTAPEIFVLLAIAIGTFFGRLQFKGFSVGATACTLVAAVLLGLLGQFAIPPLFKSIFFSLFVFTIGYKSGPEFFASLSLRTLSQVGVALVVSLTGLALVLVFASVFHLDPRNGRWSRIRQSHPIIHDRDGNRRAVTTRTG
jgi:putative transport protein